MTKIKERLLKTALNDPSRQDAAKRIETEIEQQVENGHTELLLTASDQIDEYGYVSRRAREELEIIRLYCALAELPITEVTKAGDDILVTVSLMQPLENDD